MGDRKKLHVGFQELSLRKYAKILVDHGHKVVIVEQMLDAVKGDSKACKVAGLNDRQIVGIMSKGLF
jgi:DNA mismatch repair ATPase MutS